MTIRFTTLFDMNYAVRGLAMMQSLHEHCRSDFDLTVLCMDGATRELIDRIELPRLRAIAVEDLGDPDLLALRETRPPREFCWTCTPSLIRHLYQTSESGDTVAYLDADLFFFRDPTVLLDELDGGQILVHEHRYAPDKADWIRTSGRFNVGLIAMRHGTDSTACLERWRAQCLEKCELDPENGYCGDQGYLGEWPELYEGLRVLKHIGGGVAPWNVTRYRVRAGLSGPEVDSLPLIFFHFHALRIVSTAWFGGIVVRPADAYEFSPPVISCIYKPYLRALRRCQATVSRLVSVLPGSEMSLRPQQTIRGLLSGRLVGAWG